LPQRAPFALFALALALVPHAARAQSNDDLRARADALFREGQELLGAEQIPTACAKLEESQRLDPKLGRLLNVAYCHERLGRTATAWSEYNQAAALALQTRQAERESFARKQAGQLARSLSFVQLDLAAAPEVTEVAVDGAALTRDQWAVPFPLDPGEHTVTFGAAHHKPASQTLKIASAGTSRVHVEPLEQEDRAPSESNPAPPAAAPLASPPPTPVAPEPSASQSAAAPPAHGTRTLGWIVGGVGVAGLGVGAAFGLRAMSLKSDADGQCPRHLCTPQGVSRIDDARTAATVSTVALAAGLVGVGVGAWLFLRVPSADGTQARIAPGAYVAADRAGIALNGAW
jgi:hypothetical protein